MITNAFISEIRLFPSTRIPPGWVECNGQPLQNSVFPRLRQLLEGRFGVPDAFHFQVPDLRGRTPVHGADVGRAFGSEAQALEVRHLPPHAHAARVSPRTTASQADGAWVAVSSQVAASAVVSAPGLLAPTGGQAPLPLRSPALVLVWCIAVDGEPPRPDL
jgi:microcystin-dependent protein